MHPDYSESISIEVKKFKHLLKKVESGHSFSIINYGSITVEEAEIIKEFSIEEEIDLFYPISCYKENSCSLISEEMAFYELEKCFKEAFHFNLRFYSKDKVVSLVESEIDTQIERIINLMRNSVLQFTEIEKRMSDKGGYDLVRLDFKHGSKTDTFEFIYFLD